MIIFGSTIIVIVITLAVWLLSEMAGQNVMQQLVRVFEEKRLMSSKLHDVRRHQLRSDRASVVVNSGSADCDIVDHRRSDRPQRALTRRLLHDYNSDRAARHVCLRTDQHQRTDVQHFERYFHCEFASQCILSFFSCSSNPAPTERRH